MNTLRNFAKYVFALIFAKFKYLAKKFILTKSPDQCFKMKSKRSGRDLPFMKIKCDNTKQSEPLTLGGLLCQRTGIIFKIEELRKHPRSNSVSSARVLGTRHQIVPKSRNVLCGEAHSYKNCPNKEKRNPKCANCRGPQIANCRGCPAYKDEAFKTKFPMLPSSSKLLHNLPATHLISPPIKLFPWLQTW